MPDGQLLQQMAGGFAPVVTGRPYTPTTGLEGLPFMQGGGVTSMLAQFFLAPKIQQMMGAHGMMPMGLNDQNVYDQMRRQHFTQEHQEVMKRAAESERGNFMRTFRGVAMMTGTPWGAEQRRAAGSLADLAVTASPFLAEMMPDVLDQLGGMRGSATVMASRMMLGSRYRLDPVTGRMGQSTDTVAQMSRQVYQDLYENGNLAAMKGITAGQVGSLYDELGRRGMIEGPQQSLNVRTRGVLADMQRDAPDLLLKAATNQKVALPQDVSRIGAEDLDKLRLDPAVADRLRSFDVDRVKRSLKTYTDVIGAMRDIFGDMGRPNAPMGELVQTLEAMTQGGLSRLDPGRLNMMVRQTHELAKMGGMSLDAAMGMQQHAAARAQALGIDPLHAIQATQGAMAWSTAFRASGGSAVNAWGRFNADQMTQLDTNLRVAAAASQQATQLGTLMRVREQVGAFEKGSEAEAMAQAVMAGQTEYAFGGQTKSTLMGADQFRRVMLGVKNQRGESIGMTDNELTTLLGQRYVNEEYVERYGIGNQVRRQQPKEARAWEAARIGESIASRLRSVGMDSAKASQVAEQVRGTVAREIDQMTDAQFADSRTRTGTMARIMERAMAGTEAREFLTKEGLNNDEFYRLTAEKTYGYVTDRLRADPTKRGMGSWQNMRAVMNENTLTQGANVETQARFQTAMADALSPLGRGTMLQRGVQALQDATPGTSPLEVLGKALGGVKKEDIANGLQGPMEDVAIQQKQLKALYDRYQSTENSEERQKVLAQIEEQQRSLRANVDKLVKVGEKFGMGESMISQEDVDRARDAWDSMTTGMRDTVGLAGAFGWDVSKAEQAKFKGKKVGGDEVKAIIPDEGARRMIAAELYVRREGQRAADATTDEQVKKFYDANATQFATEADAKKTLQNIRRREQMNRVRQIGVTEAQIDSTLDSDIQENEIKDLVLMGRAAQPGGPSEARIDEIRKKYGEDKVSAPEARMLAESELRAKRMGISEEDITAQRAKVQGKHGAEIEFKAIQSAIEGRFTQQLDASKIDLSKLDEKELKRVTEGTQQSLQKKDVTDEDKRNFIMQERYRDQKEKLRDFWNSDSGADFRERVNTAMSAADDIGQRFIMSKDMVQRLGPQGLKDYQTLMGQQQELRVLAMKYSAGDTARLMMGDLDVGWSTQDERKKYAQVRARVEELRTGIARSEQGLARGVGSEGRQWGNTQREAEEAAWRLMEFKIKPEGLSEDVLKLARSDFSQLSDADRKKLIDSKALTDEQRKEYRDMVSGVQVAQKLSDTGAGALTEFKERRDQLRTMAKSLGVSEADLLQAGRYRELNLSEKEAEELSRQKTRYETATGEIAAAQTEIDRLEKTKIGTEGEARKKIEAQIAEQRGKLLAAQSTQSDARRASIGRAAELGYNTVEGLFERLGRGNQAVASRLTALTDEQASDVTKVKQLREAHLAAQNDPTKSEEAKAKAKKDYEVAAGQLQTLATGRGFKTVEEFLERGGDMTRQRLSQVTGLVEQYDRAEGQATASLRGTGVGSLDEALKGMAPVERLGVLADRMRSTETMSGEAMGTRMLQAYGIDAPNKEVSARMSRFLQGRDERQVAKLLIGGAEFLGGFAEKGAEQKVKLAQEAGRAGKKDNEKTLTEEAERLRSSRGSALVQMASDYQIIKDNRELDDKKREEAFGRFRKTYGIAEGEWGMFERHMGAQISSGMIDQLRSAKGDWAKAVEMGVGTVHVGGAQAVKAAMQQQQQRMDVNITGSLTLKGNGTGDFNAQGRGTPMP